eukprot:Hpha_TRINITY_DN29916_c0_g1::TRINITY_DN29916_c0_g1_i1::g.131784::m.131784
MMMTFAEVLWGMQMMIAVLAMLTNAGVVRWGATLTFRRYPVVWIGVHWMRMTWTSPSLSQVWKGVEAGMYLMTVTTPVCTARVLGFGPECQHALRRGRVRRKRRSAGERSPKTCRRPPSRGEVLAPDTPRVERNGVAVINNRCPLPLLGSFKDHRTNRVMKVGGRRSRRKSLEKGRRRTPKRMKMKRRMRRNSSCPDPRNFPTQRRRTKLMTPLLLPSPTSPVRVCFYGALDTLLHPLSPVVRRLRPHFWRSFPIPVLPTPVPPRQPLLSLHRISGTPPPPVTPNTLDSFTSAALLLPPRVLFSTTPPSRARRRAARGRRAAKEGLEEKVWA